MSFRIIPICSDEPEILNQGQKLRSINTKHKETIPHSNEKFVRVHQIQIERSFIKNFLLNLYKIVYLLHLLNIYRKNLI